MDLVCSFCLYLPTRDRCHAIPDLSVMLQLFEYILGIFFLFYQLTFSSSVEFKLCVLTYRCLHGLGPDYFSSKFTRVSDLRPRQRLRSAYTAAALIVPATRHSTLGDQAFPVIGARLWNSLPDDITTATSLLTFRHKLKIFLFRRSYDNVDS